jgi:hypothetical protein
MIEDGPALSEAFLRHQKEVAKNANYVPLDDDSEYRGIKRELEKRNCGKIFSGIDLDLQDLDTKTVWKSL